ncbi:unnamed protein product, partial [marine sediment metagenome]
GGNTLIGNDVNYNDSGTDTKLLVDTAGAVSAVATADAYLKNDANDETTGDLTVANLITAGLVDTVDVSDLKDAFDALSYYTQAEIDGMDIHSETHILATTGPHTGTLPWTDLNKTGSNLTDLATRQHAGLTDVTSDQHHAQSRSISYLRSSEGKYCRFVCCRNYFSSR